MQYVDIDKGREGGWTVHFSGGDDIKQKQSRNKYISLRRHMKIKSANEMRHTSSNFEPF